MHEAIRSGKTTLVQIVQSYLDRARAYNGVASLLLTEDGASVPEAVGVVRATARLRVPTETVKASTILPDLDKYQGPALEFGRMEPRELLRRVDMMVILENKLDALVRLHTPWAPGLIGHPHQYDLPANLSPESLSGPNAGLTEVLIPAGYVTTTYDPVFRLSEDRKRYISAPSDVPTSLAAPGLPFSLMFRCDPGKEDIILKIASAYEAARSGAFRRRHLDRCHDSATLCAVSAQGSLRVKEVVTPSE